MPSTTSAFTEIRRLLAAARRRQARCIAGAAAGFFSAAVLLVFLIGASSLALGARIGVRPLVFGIAALLGLCVLTLAVRAVFLTAWSEEAAARSIAREEPEFRSALLSSLELARAREEIERDGHYSLALVDGHVLRTADEARRVNLRTALPNAWVRRGGQALLGVAVAYLAAFAFGRGGLVRAYGRVLGGDPESAIATAVDPITGDIELTYRYPSYMRREPRTVSGTGGEIRAPLGTEVEMKTRADRLVKAAELSVSSSDPALANTAAPLSKQVSLTVTNGRDLEGRLLVDSPGSYRFRFLDRPGKVVAEGPAIPVTVEPDLPPQVRITSPEREIEVDPSAVVKIDWQAEDDVGLGEVSLIVKAPGAEEKRTVLRKPDGASRDERGEELLDLAPEKLAEGESLEYRVEATDGDTISGPKKASSQTHTVKIYSEADHRREVLEKARQVYEEMVLLLGDRLESFAAGPPTTLERIGVAQSLDMRVRHLHEHMRDVARDLRKEKAGTAALASALANVAGSIRPLVSQVLNARNTLASVVRLKMRIDGNLTHTMSGLDRALNSELEKDVLYLETLMDKERAEDLVRMAKDLASNRRELADLLGKLKSAPSDAAKKEVLARVERMKNRVRELMSRMAELAKGFQDEHMNEEAVAELQKSKDLMNGLDDVKKKLAAGDLEGAMKALDEMASAMDQMLAGLEKTAGIPDQANQELMKDMLAFREKLKDVQKEQESTAQETEKIRSEYREKLAEKMKSEEAELKRLVKLAEDAKEDVYEAQPGVTFRAEVEYESAREGLTNLSRALGMRDLGAAYDTAQKAVPATERLSQFLEEDAGVGMGVDTPFATGTSTDRVRDASDHVREAVPKAREVREALSRMFPDPRKVLGKDSQKKLSKLSEREAGLEKEAQGLEQKLRDLAQRAPVFPPEAQAQLGESRSHMGQAAADLQAKNPQRGHGEQELALEALQRFEKGLEEAAKKGKGGSGSNGFPFPFAEQGGGEEGEGREPSPEHVNIPGAEAHKVPAEFRKDLLEAMKQGAPERYRAEVKRYYEELVK